MLTSSEVYNLVSDGKFFTVTFVKRTTGEIRVMNCRVGVKRHLTGGSLPFDPKKKNLLVVWDRPKKGYRLVSCENILTIRHHNKLYWRMPNGSYSESTKRGGQRPRTGGTLSDAISFPGDAGAGFSGDENSTIRVPKRGSA